MGGALVVLYGNYIWSNYFCCNFLAIGHDCIVFTSDLHSVFGSRSERLMSAASFRSYITGISRHFQQLTTSSFKHLSGTELPAE